jgi:hypothetical protein
MELRLDSGETDLLQRVLGSYLSELRAEIVKTENFDLRQNLKRDEEQIKSLLARLGRVEG